ncbi:hypothetical protein [Nocardia sp. NPDC048505]|uniref:hypothetical protein n=1 Tax=unclassified Nocardia TaxID=2637762 RepID=UPI0033D4663C
MRRVPALVMVSACTAALLLCGARSGADPEVPGLGDLGTGSALPEAALPESGSAGIPMRLGPAAAPTAVAIPAPAPVPEPEPQELALEPVAAEPVVLGLDSGSMLTACAGSAVLGGSALLSGSALGSAGSSGSGSPSLALWLLTGSAVTGSGVGSSGSALGSAAVGSALTGSALLTCLLAIPDPVAPPGIPLLIPPVALPPLVPVAAPVAVPAPSPEPETPAVPGRLAASTPEIEAGEPEPAVEPKGLSTLAVVTLMVVAVIATRSAGRSRGRAR